MASFLARFGTIPLRGVRAASRLRGLDRWTEIALFVKTAELGSLSKAAEALQLSDSSASRHLASLEQRLGVRLIERTTRRLSLTELGTDYLARCRAALNEIAEADSAASAASAAPSGQIRVTASLSFCVGYLAPMLPSYCARYPGVRVHLEAANRYFELLDSGIDLAFRTREFEPDSSITVRRLASTRRVVAASPEYLGRRGVPVTPDDLLSHTLLLYTYANRPHELHFTDATGRETMVPVRGLLESNDGQIIRTAALNGLGLLVQPRFVIHDDIVAGRLVPVLDAWDLPRLTINVAYPSRRFLPAKVRSFIDFVSERFQANGYERKWTE
jgi:DNA-binding transcriptional LysR family regulator